MQPLKTLHDKCVRHRRRLKTLASAEEEGTKLLRTRVESQYEQLVNALKNRKDLLLSEIDRAAAKSNKFRALVTPSVRMNERQVKEYDLRCQELLKGNYLDRTVRLEAFMKTFPDSHPIPTIPADVASLQMDSDELIWSNKIGRFGEVVCHVQDLSSLGIIPEFVREEWFPQSPMSQSSDMIEEDVKFDAENWTREESIKWLLDTAEARKIKKIEPLLDVIHRGSNLFSLTEPYLLQIGMKKVSIKKLLDSIEKIRPATLKPKLEPEPRIGGYRLSVHDVDPKKVTEEPKGLHNLGNTCYMNAAIQCFAQAPRLRDFFLYHITNPDVKIYHQNPSGSQGRLTKAWTKLVRQLFSESSHYGYSSLNPRDFKSALETFDSQFRGYHQDDSAAVIRSLCGALHEDLNEHWKSEFTHSKFECYEKQIASKLPQFESTFWEEYFMTNNSPISKECCGLVMLTTCCNHCSFTQIVFENYNVLELPTSWSLRESFQKYRQTSSLAANSGWICPSCRYSRGCVMTKRIRYLPPTLMLQFERRDTVHASTKNSSRITYQSEDDFSPFIDGDNPPHLYRLFGVCNHSGGAFSGHYTATVNPYNSSQWYSCNDSSVRKTTPHKTNSNAILLFYHRVE
jgi:ubiquitin C-terminal hydrolase